jgi:uncharacterized membrane protein
MTHEDECDCGRHVGFCACHPFRIIVGIIIFVIVLSVIFSVVRSVLVGAVGMMSYSYPVLHLFFGILVFIFVVWLIVWIVRWPLHRMHAHMHEHVHGDRAPRILRRRYAKGEISETQFKRMMKNLKEEQ